MTQILSNEVSDFLLQNLPKDFVEGLNVLSTLKMPINDRLSFTAILEEHPTEDRNKKLLIQIFRPQDFPILSTQNSFEKFYEKYQTLPMRFPSMQLPALNLPDFSFRPAACDVFHQTFGTVAADCACKVYGEAIRAGYNSYQATIIGHFAGIKATETGRCEYFSN